MSEHSPPASTRIQDFLDAVLSAAASAESDAASESASHPTVALRSLGLSAEEVVRAYADVLLNLSDEEFALAERDLTWASVVEEVEAHGHVVSVLPRAQLFAADLRGLHLGRAIMDEANLEGARLDRCGLAGARLVRANLAGAQLRFADLSGAILVGADLTGADLSGAVLVGADLRDATLNAVRWDGARCDQPTLGLDPLEQDSNLASEVSPELARKPRMKVVGVGSGGGSAVNRMMDEDLEGVEFISVNTNAQALKMYKSEVKIQLGAKLTLGLGAGARPEIGRGALEENRDDMRKALDGADLVFITAGMGGGTGTGAAPLIAEIAREMGALTIAIVTRPFLFEGKKRMKQAEEGLAELRRTADTVIVVSNERLLSMVGKETSFKDALKKADEVLLHATQGISDLIRVTGEVNVDFADVRTVMSNRGAARVGTGFGKGENRAVEAAQEAISSPLLDNISIHGAAGLLINITGGMDLSTDEVNTICTIIQYAASDEAEIIFSAVHDSNMKEEVRVTVICIGLEKEAPQEALEGRDGVLRPDFRSGPRVETGRGDLRSRTRPVVPPGTPLSPPARDTPPGPAAPAAEDGATPLHRWQPARNADPRLPSDLEIPTFIRRQMD